MTTQQARVWPASPTPLGATRDGNGANFALFSTHPKGMELCPFHQAGERETERLRLPSIASSGETGVGDLATFAPGARHPGEPRVLALLRRLGNGATV
ncbi:MAG: hypothetical protein ISP49_02780 [Reyranella sp.]|nr:hypothetical protein [Reyranella sp.]MBL6650488.1 hypothetical protein [Reyranella sp.]